MERVPTAPLTRTRGTQKSPSLPDWTLTPQATFDVDAILAGVHPHTERNARRILKMGGVTKNNSVMFGVATWHKPSSPVLVSWESDRLACRNCSGRSHLDPCGHILAVMIWLQEERQRARTPARRLEAHERNWRAINQYRKTAKYLFPRILSGALLTVSNAAAPQARRGRRRKPLRSMLFATLMRTAMDEDLGDAHSTLQEPRYQRYNPHGSYMNAPSRLLNQPWLEPILHELLMATAQPVQHIETEFAIDGTGFSCNTFSPVLEAKNGIQRRRQHEFYMAIQVTGTATNIVPAVSIFKGFTAEGRHLLPLYERVRKRFPRIAKWTADAAYHSRANYLPQDRDGVETWIVSPSNRRGTAKGSPAYRAKTRMFTMDPANFFRSYAGHQNVEATNHMVQARLGWVLRSRNHTARINETLCKYIVHNLHVLLQENARSGLIPKFEPAHHQPQSSILHF